MPLLRYRLRPVSPWITPWQADTLTGLLCCAMARRDGREEMYAKIQEPALRGEPPFVLSDALPGDLLPAPITLRLQEWPPTDRKKIKAARWLTHDAFQRAQGGAKLEAKDLAVAEPYKVHDRWRNTLDRLNGSAGGEGGNLFVSTETSLAVATNEAENVLSVYARVSEDWIDQLTGLFRELAESGFGADASIGRGQFELADEPKPAEWLDAPGPAATGCISLSTFQPAPADPTEGHWESFVKYGRLAPDFGVENVFKHSVLMLRPGAVFATPAGSPPTLGRAIPMRELLPDSTADQLAADGREIVQLAFGLAVPFPPSGPMASTPL